jgi:hypothetical protein
MKRFFLIFKSSVWFSLSSRPFSNFIGSYHLPTVALYAFAGKTLGTRMNPTNSSCSSWPSWFLFSPTSVQLSFQRKLSFNEVNSLQSVEYGLGVEVRIDFPIVVFPYGAAVGFEFEGKVAEIVPELTVHIETRIGAVHGIQ